MTKQATNSLLESSNNHNNQQHTHTNVHTSRVQAERKGTYETAATRAIQLQVQSHARLVVAADMALKKIKMKLFPALENSSRDLFSGTNLWAKVEKKYLPW